MILACPTAFKGTLSARDAAAAVAAGARAAGASPVTVLPLSDGGHGLLDALEAAAGGKGHGVRVAGPLGTSVTARCLTQERRVVIETAEACGLHLVPPTLRDPMRASTRGVGELLLAAADAASHPGEDRDPSTIVVGLGGSATVDAGAGMAAALGWRFLDPAGEPIAPGAAGLLELAAIEPPPAPLPLGDLVVLADVSNPLLGDGGAAAVYGPQKGAGPDDVPVLDEALGRWADVVRAHVGRDVAGLAGAGAAGGLGAAFAALLDAPPRPGADWLLDAVGFDALLADAAVVVTGEGSWDASSSMGKVTGAVARRAAAAGVPVLLVTGAVEGAVPAGVTVAAGEAAVAGGAGGAGGADVDTGVEAGRRLDADDVAGLVEAALPGLLAGRRAR